MIQRIQPTQTKILIVEDDPASAFILQNTLAEARYEIVGPAHSGENALELAQRTEPDLMLMDVRIQGQWDGVETVNRIQKACKVPVIYITGNADVNVIQRLKATTQFGLILKPYSPQEVLVAVELALYKYQSEKELQETQQHLAATLGSLQDLVITTDSDGYITYLNPAAECHLGVLSKDAVDRPIDRLLQLFDATTQARIDALFDDDKGFLGLNGTNLFYSTPTHGDRLLFSVHTTPLVTPNGATTHFVFTLHDITVRTQVAQHNTLLANALETIADAVAVTAEPAASFANIVYANNGFCALTQMDEDTLRDHSIFAVFDKNTEYALRTALKEAITQQRCVTLDAKLSTNNAEIWVACRLAPVYAPNQDVTHIVWVLSDITQKRQAQVIEQQANKIEAIGQLARGIAHDFNNLLSVITSYSELLQNALPADHAFIHYAQAIHDAGRKEAALIHQLMAFSGCETLQLEDVNFVDYMTRYVNEKKSSLPTHVTVQTNFPKIDLIVHIDAAQLQHALDAVVQNAVEAMPNGGTLSLQLQPIPKVEGKNTPGLACSIQDTGCGVPTNYLPHVFEPFFTTKPIGSGNGLGLATAYGTLQQHGGNITLSSQVNVGTSVTLQLPLSVPETSTHKALKQKNGANMCILSQDPLIAECLAGLLKTRGHRVVNEPDPDFLRTHTDKNNIIILNLTKNKKESIIKILKTLHTSNGIERFVVLNDHMHPTSTEHLDTPYKVKFVPPHTPLKQIAACVESLILEA